MKEFIKDSLRDTGLALATVVLAALVLTVICVIDEYMSWGYIVVLSTILYTSWRIGQPMIARREIKKRENIKTSRTYGKK